MIYITKRILLGQHDKVARIQVETGIERTLSFDSYGQELYQKNPRS